MKKILLAILLFAGAASAQVKISDLPTFIGNPAGGWVPVVIAGVTRKMDPATFGPDTSLLKKKSDSLNAITGYTSLYQNSLKSTKFVTNIKDYGALGNGSADDQAGINAAITAAGANGTIIFPSGTYNVSTYIQSTAVNQTFISYGATITATTANHYIFLIQHDSCTVQGFNIRGNGTAAGDFLGTAILVNGSSHIRILYNNIYNPSSCGIEFIEGTNAGSLKDTSCNYNEVAHNYIFRPLGPAATSAGILFGYNTVKHHRFNSIHNNWVEGGDSSNFGIAFIGNADNVNILDNTVRHFKGYGIIVYPKPTSGADDSIYSVVVKGNKIDSIGVLTGTTAFGSGVYLNSVEDAIVQDNIIDNATLGYNLSGTLAVGSISVGGGHKISIANNIIDSSYYVGINVADAYLTSISGNKINSTYRGISIEGIPDRNIQIQNNDITSGDNGIYSNAIDSVVTVKNNTILSKSIGIYLVPTTGKSITIQGNDITAVTSGIYMSHPDNFNITGNTIILKSAVSGIDATTSTNGNISNNKVFSTDGSAITNKILAAAGTLNVGTANYVSRWKDKNIQDLSIIQDDGTNIGVNKTPARGRMDVAGFINSDGTYTIGGYRLAGNLVIASTTGTDLIMGDFLNNYTTTDIYNHGGQALHFQSGSMIAIQAMNHTLKSNYLTNPTMGAGDSLAMPDKKYVDSAIANVGSAVASATAIAPTGNIFHVTGTTTITSITATNVKAGTRLTIIFDGILTFTDGSNLKLAGNFTTGADATISLIFDGTNFYETSRSTN